MKVVFLFLAGFACGTSWFWIWTLFFDFIEQLKIQVKEEIIKIIINRKIKKDYVDLTFWTYL